MPDKTPDWKADEAFWDNAWQDMERRLDGRRSRPWWLLIPLLLLAIWAGTQVQSSSEKPSNEPQSPVPSSVPPPTTTPADTTNLADKIAKSTVSSQGDPPAQLVRLPPIQTAASASFRPTDSVASSPRLHPASAPQILPTPGVSMLSRLPLLTPDFPLLSLRIRELPKVEAADTTTFISLPEWQPNVLAGTGAQIHASDRPPGAYLEAGAVVMRGKWFIPLLLRYDYGRRSVELVPEEAAQLEADLSGAFQNQSFSRYSADESEYTGTLRLHTLALTAGLGRQIGKRFAVSSGAGIGYLLSGEVPGLRSVPLAGGNSAAYQFDLRGLQSTNAATVTPGLSVGNPQPRPLQTELRRWDLTGWGRLEYRFGSRWSVGVEASYHLRSIYRDDLLREGRSRVAIGLRRRW
jgi:hypothetical protein